jgi:spermidine/putrescine transport system permease protein
MRRHAEQIRDRRALWLSAPALLWVAMLFLGPMLFVIGISFYNRGTFGELELPLTFSNYQRVVGFGLFGWEATYPVILLRSLVLAAATMLICLLLGGPLAFFIAGLPNRYKTFALTLVVIPLWTNLLIRTYAWQLLLEPQGWIARLATALGALNPGEGLHPGTGAVLVGLVCDYLPFLVLPLYASVEKIDWTLTEAARDLGASGWRLFRHAILPQILPGMAAGLVLVFVPAIGQFVIPDLLGGSKTALLGNVVQQQFGSSRDWPFGSALATVAMGVVLAALCLQARVTRRKGKSLEL